MNKRIREIMSVVLLMALMFGAFGDMTSAPVAKAAAPHWSISAKFASYDARADSYADCGNETLYSGEQTTIFFKRTDGPRIPKGSYVVVFKQADYDSLRAEGLPIVQNTGYAKYKGSKSQSSSNTRWWYFKNGFSAGSYVVCLMLPYYDESSRSKKYTYFWWKRKVYNYG